MVCFTASHKRTPHTFRPLSFRDAQYLFFFAFACFGVLLPSMDAQQILCCICGAFLRWIILLSGVLSHRAHSFFPEFRVGAPPVSSLLSPLHGFTFVRLFLILLWKSIVIAFFSIFLLVPGIWKAYELKMVPYLLAENPYLSKSRAFTLSKKMMHQEKVRLFLLDLPFFAVFSASIAWAGAWAFLILLIILPFYCALQAEVYALLRAKALTYEWTDEGELSGFFRYPVVNQEL